MNNNYAELLLNEMWLTDLPNVKTNLANYNEKTINVVQQSFRKSRLQTIGLPKEIDEATIFKSALHPSLQVP